MGDYRELKPAFTNRGTTLSVLKEELYSLNMRMLWAMQNHEEGAQEEIKKQMAEVQEEIDRMCLRNGYQKRN